MIEIVIRFIDNLMLKIEESRADRDRLMCFSSLPISKVFLQLTFFHEFQYFLIGNLTRQQQWKGLGTCRSWTQARVQQRWKALEPQLTALYLYLKHYTHNWTSQPSMNSYLSDEIQCECSPERLQRLNIDLIDLFGRTSKHWVTFCKCVPDVVCLLHIGFVAGLPQLCTAFSVWLVQFNHHLWNNTVISNSRSWDVLTVFLNEQCDSRLKTQNVKGTFMKNLNRGLRHPFNQVINIFCQILLGEQSLYEEGLELTPFELSAAQCCCCFGLAKAEVKVSPNKPDFIIAMDGYFQHHHQSHTNQYPDSFIQPSKLEKEVVASQQTNAQAHNIKTSCSNSHTAANDVCNRSSWDRCGETGLFVAACCHDGPLHFVNIYQSGEKLYYPVAILKQLQELYSDKVMGILYNIGFHLDKYIAKMMFGMLVLHAHIHQWACPIKYHPRFNKYWGLSDSKGLKRLWLFLLALVNTVNILREAQAAVASLCVMPNPAQPGENYSINLVRGQWTVERKAYTSMQAILLKQQKYIGTLDISNLNKEQEYFLKLWYSKHEVGLNFITFCEEERPLQQS
ncbi:hypothetical protein DFH28DRAFT_1088308 [Melampsora americana]|nr:hypothetical protein DFH28DRAFT_1088308 [Melampsora americana]